MKPSKTHISPTSHHKMILIGGWCMVIFALLFVGLTIIIDFLVPYQPVLYTLEAHHLFKVVAGTRTIQFLLCLYASVPMLLIPAAVGTYYAFIEKHEANMRVALHFATLGAFAMSMSLMMLPSLNWTLTSALEYAPVQQKLVIIVLLRAFHSYFGIFVGDILGLGGILVWIFIASFVMLKDQVLPVNMAKIELGLAFIMAAVLLLRYTGIIANIHEVIQINSLIALWFFICGMGLISLPQK